MSSSIELTELREGDRVRVTATFEATVLAPADSDGDVPVQLDGLQGRGWILKDEVENLGTEVVRLAVPKSEDELEAA